MNVFADQDAVIDLQVAQVEAPWIVGIEFPPEPNTPTGGCQHAHQLRVGI
jgi:hypothetical protein